MEHSRTIQTNKRHLLSFFILSYVIAWAVWIPAGLFAPDLQVLILPGAWAPTIAALIVTGLAEGKTGIKTLLKSLLKWRVHPGYYLFAVAGVLALVTVAVALHAASGGEVPGIADIAARFGFPEDQPLMFLLFSPVIYLATIFIGGPVAEELGWRGYAQPKLQAHTGAGYAGVLIGFIWSLWHLPLFFYFPTAVGGLPIEYYIPVVTSIGVFFAWLYNRTGGSVLLCILLHAGVNFAIGVIGAGILTEDSTLLIIFTVLIALTAIYLFLKAQLGDTVGEDTDN